MTPTEAKARNFTKRFLGTADLDEVWRKLDAGEVADMALVSSLTKLRHKIAEQTAKKKLPRAVIHTDALPLKHARGRESAEGNPAHALRAALGCRYEPLRKAAIEVLREAFRSCRTKASVCNFLRIPELTFNELRRDFPLEFHSAASLNRKKIKAHRSLL